MRVIGLTGGIASGKSTVSHMLKGLGAVVVDADQIARQVVAKGEPAWYEIAACFGEEYLTDGGDINRSKLGEMVFSNSEALKNLNRITHPRIQHQIIKAVEAYREKNADNIVIIDAALLIEAGWYDMVDEVWLVAVTEDIQLKRLMERNSISLQQAQRIIASQMSQEKKKVFAKHIIDNSNTVKETKQQVMALWNKMNLEEH